MSVSISAAEYKKVLSALAKLKKNGINIASLLHGRHAIGKTEVHAQWAQENGYNFVPLYLSTQDVPDLIGIPYRNAEDQSSRFAKPDWLADALSDKRDALFFLDEINRAQPYVLQTMLPFTLAGTLHTHKIRPGDMVVAAMNPDTADYNVTSMSDKALMSRFGHFYFEPEYSEWVSFCTKAKVHPAILSVTNTNPMIVDAGLSVKDTERYFAKPDRRNMFKIGMMLNILTAEELDQVGIKLIASMIGMDSAGLVFNAYRDFKAPTIEDVFNGKIFDKIKNFEEELDKLAMLNEALVDFLAGKSFKVTLSKTQLEHVRKYFGLLPKDSTFGFVRGLKYRMAEDFKTSTPEERNKQLLHFLNDLDDKIYDKISSYVPPAEKKEKEEKKK